MDIDFHANPELMDRMGIDVMPCFSIYAASNAVMRFYRKTLGDLGLTYPQFLVMMVLWETKGVTMKVLGERLSLDSNTLTPLVKKLEAQRLVVRARNKADERLLDIAPTDKAMAMRPDGCEAAISLIAGSGETLESMMELTQRMHRLRAALDAATVARDARR